MSILKTKKYSQPTLVKNKHVGGKKNKETKKQK